MPLFESACPEKDCLLFEKTFEWLSKTTDVNDPSCECCGAQTIRQISRFGVIWTGPITAKYLDKSLEGGNAESGGHWAYKKNTLSGKPEPVYISTFQEQREYCKAEGLTPPQDTDHGMIQGDGRTVVKATAKEAHEFIEHSKHETPKQQAETAVS